MGDALRNAIAISGYWTDKERDSYFHIASEKLGSAYLVEGIPKTQPADRARYLDKKLNIEDNGKIEKSILATARKHGKVHALLALEKIAIDRFY